MTHVRYTQQALSRYNLPRLKRIATELGVTPTLDKRAAQTWVNAILTHQSTQLQKLDNQTTAQAELDQFIADQAQAVAPEPLRIVEISFGDHEYYAGNQLVASITHDDDHLTQRWEQCDFVRQPQKSAITKNYSQYSKIFITALAVLTLDK